jgi:hypothetical protein
MTAHTPGPWTVENKLNRDWSPTLVVGGEHGVLIADCGMTLLVPTPVASANARLIAAAPALLAALRDIVAACQKAGVAIVDQSRGRDAIAQAEGAQC